MGCPYYVCFKPDGDRQSGHHALADYEHEVRADPNDAAAVNNCGVVYRLKPDRLAVVRDAAIEISFELANSVVILEEGWLSIKIKP